MTVSRREFVRRATGAVGFGALAGLAAACADEHAALRSTLGNGNSDVRILNWTAYIDTGDEGTVARFGRERNISAEYVEEFDDNIDVYDTVLAPRLSKGQRVPFDIVCPTFWLAARLIGQGWVEPLPLAAIPNHANLDVAFLRQPFDRGARFNLPWQSGITGIAYNSALTGPVGSVNDLFTRTDLKGQVGFFTEMRDSIGLAMLSLGSDPSRATKASAEAALVRLEQATRDGQILRFADNTGYLDALQAGEFAACVAWSGDLVQLQRDRPEFKFLIAEEGGMQWFDTMVIPRRSPNGAAVAAWMNYVYEPENAARITAAVKYISPVIGVREALVARGGEDAGLADSPLLFPDEATRKRLFTWHGTTAADEDDLAVRFSELIGN